MFNMFKRRVYGPTTKIRPFKDKIDWPAVGGAVILGVVVVAVIF